MLRLQSIPMFTQHSSITSSICSTSMSCLRSEPVSHWPQRDLPSPFLKMISWVVRKWSAKGSGFFQAIRRGALALLRILHLSILNVSLSVEKRSGYISSPSTAVVSKGESMFSRRAHFSLSSSLSF